LSAYLETLYDEVAAERAAVLREECPAFWDEQSATFTGPVSTNAIEGGNWRLKYGNPNAVRVSAIGAAALAYTEHHRPSGLI